MSTVTGRFCSITWKIVNYSSNTLKNNERFESPVFQTENFHGTKWFLSFYPKGTLHDSYYTELVLGQNISDNFKYVGGFSAAVEILDTLGNVLVSFESYCDCKMSKPDSTCMHENISIKDLADKMKTCKEDTLVIRCHLSKTGYNQQVTMCDVLTKVLVRKHVLKWKLKLSEILNWTKIVEVPFQNKPKFSIRTKSSNDNKIHFEIKKIDTPLEFAVNFLQMFPIGEAVKNFCADELYKLEFFVLNDEGIQMNLETPTFSFHTRDGNPLFEFDTSIGRKNIESVSFICVIYYSSGVWSSEIEGYSYGEVKQHFVAPSLSLPEDLKNMFLSKKHTDLTLRIGNETIPVHKSLLCARSPVFSAMFDNEMLENQTGKVIISDVDIGTMRSFLEFLYTDTITNTKNKHLLKLLLVADKYQVNVLKGHCSDILVSKLSPENICDVISIAEMINHANLKSSALEYIKRNKKSILSTPVWANWVKKNMKLSNDILSKVLLQ